jgi:hypothetical protein
MTLSRHPSDTLPERPAGSAGEAFDQLAREHRALMLDYAEVQSRCTRQLQAQAREIERLRAQLVRDRGRAIRRETELAWQQEDSLAIERALPEIPDAQALESTLRAADLVICQTGCLTHRDYWRVQDHCKRTGKACVMVEQPDAVRIVRIAPGPAARGAKA